MLIRTLQQFEPFQDLRAPELQTIANHAQVLQLPPSRWLLKPGRRLLGAYFLVQGRLSLLQSGLATSSTRPGLPTGASVTELVGQESAASRAFYPGAVAIRTLTTVQVLQIDLAPIEFLFHSVSAPATEYPATLGDHAWLSRFLNSPMLCPLSRERWRGLLQGSRLEPVSRHAVVVRAGEPGEDFFVIKQGSAKVERQGKVLAHLSPGDFFGEDALVTGAPRNATVTMCAAGELLRLGKAQFLHHLLSALLAVGETISRPKDAGRCELWVGLQPPPESTVDAVLRQHAPLYRFRETARTLSPRQIYGLAGGSKEEQALALLLLSQQGLRGYFTEPFTEEMVGPIPEPAEAMV